MIAYTDTLWFPYTVSDFVTTVSAGINISLTIFLFFFPFIPLVVTTQTFCWRKPKVYDPYRKCIIDEVEFDGSLLLREDIEVGLLDKTEETS